MTRRANRAKDESGTASIEFVWLSVLLLVPFVYGLIGIFDVQRAAFGVSVASRSAARAYLLSDDPSSARNRAELAARVALDDQRVENATVTLTCIPRNGCLRPESALRVVVSSRVPLPLLGSDARWGGITVDSTHTQSFGRFRAEER